MTTGISLVRENTASMRPPRALWVSFPLGRPLGKPGDAAFQHEVIAAALGLLGRPRGPVLEDFPRDAPVAAAAEGAACPLSFPKQKGSPTSWAARLRSEHAFLAPWYALSLRRRKGRTLVGVSGEAPEALLEGLATYLDTGKKPEDIRWLKRAVEDLKVWALEAMTAQPREYDPSAMNRSFWQDTVLGAAILAFYHQFQNSEKAGDRLVARMLAPREAVARENG